MRILVTGFEPFGSLARNPSGEIVDRLAARAQTSKRRRLELRAEVLPTEYDAAARGITRLIAEFQPEAIVSLGVAASSDCVRLERIALNLDDAEAPDNAGKRRLARPIVPGAPMVYFSSLPLDRMLRTLRRAKIPTVISNHAGTYVCNHVFYAACHRLDELERRIPCGFIHVPNVPSARASARTDVRLTVDSLADSIERLLTLLARSAAASKPDIGRSLRFGIKP
jgi:pyroglutamyl-peptidase